MDSKATKLLRQTQHQLQNVPKLLLLPAIYFLVAVVVFPDQPYLNPLNAMLYSSRPLNSTVNSTSAATYRNQSSSSSSSSSSPSSPSATRERITDSYYVPGTSPITDDPTSQNDSIPSSNASLNDHPTEAPDASVAAAATTKNRSRTPAARDPAKTCDLFKGNWIPSPDAPYYTNLTCSMIQQHQNCMKYGRPDTDFLKWRWKPHDCELPLFEPLSFLETVRGKSMAFVGDSLARNHMQSLLCLLSRVDIPEDVDMGSIEIKRLFYADYNFTITIFWSPYLVKAKEMKKFGHWYIYLDEVDTRWASRLEEFDYLIISGANWFTRPSLYFAGGFVQGCNYCQKKRYTIRSLSYANKMAFQTVFRTINSAANYKGLTIMRTVSPSHFENGPWNHGGNCRRTRPSRPGESEFPRNEQEMYQTQLEVFEAAQAEGRRKGLEFKLMDMTGAMLMRPDGHPDRYGHWPNEYVTMHNDCVHWCLPGPVDMWNELLQQMISA